MLWNKLIGGASPAVELEFVGGSAASAVATSSPTFSLTGLSGGLASAPAVGDLVVAIVGFVNSTNRTISSLSEGWVKVADLYANASDDTQLGVFYKYLTEEGTTVQFALGVSVVSRCCLHVWRGADPVAPLDATTTTATRTGNSAPEAPSITTVTNKAVVIAVGVGANHRGTSMSLGAPTGMENFFKSDNPTARGMPQTVIASAFVETAGAFNPPAFTGNVADSGNSACAATLALRPA
jgi:hypothetical protein